MISLPLAKLEVNHHARLASPVPREFGIASTASCSWRSIVGRGYCASTICLDEAKIRVYIRNQEAEEKRQEQLYIQGL